VTASDTPKSAAEQKLDVARKVYRALAAQDADRAITLCDIRGKLIARHDLRPEKDDPKIASLHGKYSPRPAGCAEPANRGPGVLLLAR
jgi:hypothetical protein